MCDFLATEVFFKLLFIFGCVGSSFLCWLFSSGSEQGLHPSCGAKASQCGGFSSCRAQALEHRLNNYGTEASLLHSIWDLVDPGSNLCLLHWQTDCLIYP